MRKLRAKWTVETTEEWREAVLPKPPYSDELIFYWKTFLLYADLLCGYTYTTRLKRKNL